MPSLFKTSIKPSRICLGTASFGSDIPRKQAFAVLDAYVEAGGNFLDTAHIYAAWREGGWGASERTVGEWIRSNGLRDHIVLATKGAHPPLDDLDHGRSSQADIDHDLNESLERLGVDWVDMYWLHRDDPERPVGEIVETLVACVKDGRILSYGGSNWSTERLEAANRYASEHGLPPFAANQPGWALADRASTTPPVPGMVFLDEDGRRWHERTRLPVAAYSAQAKGYFGDENVAWARHGFSGQVPHGAEYDSTASRERLLVTLSLSDEKGCTANQIALAYLLRQSFPVFPIIGTSQPDRVREALEAESVTLSPTEVQLLHG